MTPSGSRRVVGWAALTAGLGASTAAVLLVMQAGRPAADAGTLPVSIPGAVAAAADPLVTPAATPVTPVATPVTPAAAPVAGWATPTRLTIGALRVDAPVDAVGVGTGGALAVPDDPARVGWWIGSAAPGSARGTVLLAGHVDTAGQGPGALFRLERMPMGTTITVRAGTRTSTYRATARRSYDKERLPTELFRAGTAPRLALVTCGGTFHHGTYSHNLVVYAEPVG
jgi:hypothetical protein